MDILQETKDINKKSFLSHVFSTTEESKAEILNVIQYAIFGVIPVVILNKTIQKFIPDADTENSSLELLAEILIQLIIMFCGIILIHRMITYLPTYSGFKYENLTLTNIILGFLIIILSIQTKIGIKVNILFDRAMELWNGTSKDNEIIIKKKYNNNVNQMRHTPSQSDYLDNSKIQQGIFPPAPVATTQQNTLMEGYNNNTPVLQMKPQVEQNSYMGPMAANSVLGGSFGSAF